MSSLRGALAVAMILGGVDATGPHLYCVFPHGSACTQPYVSMGTVLSLTSGRSTRSERTAASLPTPSEQC